MSSLLFRLTSLLVLFTMPLTVVARAADLDAIKASMVQRLPAIDALKAKGALGENNQGYLSVRQDIGDATAVAAAENQDRAAVYAGLAEKTGVTTATVGQARARQLAANSARGVWVQSPGGEWYRK